MERCFCDASSSQQTKEDFHWRREIHSFWQSKPAARISVVICQHLRNEDYLLVGASCRRLLLYCCWFAFSSSTSERLAGPLRAVVGWPRTPSTAWKNVSPNPSAFPQTPMPFPKCRCLSPNPSVFPQTAGLSTIWGDRQPPSFDAADLHHSRPLVIKK